ncbi:MAG: acyl-CoA dehydrogenase [Candidatus Caenarcaniphilales bacterium]|jgi:butyryl-CoA dehydrogenase|nr:acyl-CoA dehydrogenase [Candidatus Caenarcaniphilales bacterium]
MDFTYTEDQKMLQKMVRDIASKEFTERAKEIDKSHRFPKENVQIMAEAGLMGITIDPKYGGGGMDYVCYSIAMEELSRVCASTGTIMSAHLSLCTMPIQDWGSEELKQKYLPDLASGKKLGAFALSEPGNGSDAAAMRTEAKEDGDYYILNGSKAWITNGAEADVYLILAQTNREMKHKGVTAFIVDKGAEGFSFGKPEDKLGIRASSTTQLHFDNCRVHKSQILSKLGDGFKIAMKTLDGGRIGMASQAIGIARAALEESMAYANVREAFGQKINEFQAIQFKLADMSVDIDAARLLAYAAATAHDRGEPFSRLAAQAKLFASEMAMKHTVQAIQVHGGYGYTTEYNVERYMRDAKITEIYEGTSEIQRIVIAKALMKEML